MSNTSQARNARAALDLDGVRVLLVEDDVLIAMDIEYALEDAGAEIVGPAGDLTRALDLAREAQIDAAVLDIDLGGVDVFPAADLLEQRGIPYLFHTGHGDRSDLKALYPNAPVCLKPSRMDHLIGQIAKLACG